MTRRRKKKGKGSPAPLRWLEGVWQRLQSWSLPRWGGWKFELGPMQRDLLGLVLMIVAILTMLGLLRVSSGSVLVWWSSLLRRLFGWGVYPVVILGLGLVGLGLLWRDLAERVPVTPATVVGLELLLLAFLVASHAPLVIRQGADEAFLAANRGEAGGYVGWALATLLVEGLGALIGALVLVAVVMVGFYLLLPISWLDVQDWGAYYGRRVVAGLSRWWTARQGQPVAPEVAEVPWWEQEPDPAEAQAAKRKTKKPRKKRTRRRPQPAAGALPPMDLLDPASPQAYGDTDVRRKAQIIEETLVSFGVPAQVVEVNQGPTVTQFGLDPGYVEKRGSGGEVRQQRVRVARIASLSNDLALALAAAPIRIEAPVPGRSVVGLEV
ncbi:MAG: DNA translocase FtsK 4TM domain-containing protein, partial [Anaerolineae bacterium]